MSLKRGFTSLRYGYKSFSAVKTPLSVKFALILMIAAVAAVLSAAIIAPQVSGDFGGPGILVFGGVSWNIVWHQRHSADCFWRAAPKAMDGANQVSNCARLFDPSSSCDGHPFFAASIYGQLMHTHRHSWRG
jgi:hypothetical protein